MTLFPYTTLFRSIFILKAIHCNQNQTYPTCEWSTRRVHLLNIAVGAHASIAVGFYPRPLHSLYLSLFDWWWITVSWKFLPVCLFLGYSSSHHSSSDRRNSCLWMNLHQTVNMVSIRFWHLWRKMGPFMKKTKHIKAVINIVQEILVCTLIFFNLSIS